MPLPIEVTREFLARRKEPCAPGCPGWGVGDEIQRCDDCARINGYSGDVDDDDVAALPEAQAELVRLAGPAWEVSVSGQVTVYATVVVHAKDAEAAKHLVRAMEHDEFDWTDELGAATAGPRNFDIDDSQASDEEDAP